MVNLFANNDNNQEKKEKNNFEIWTNPEQKEQFDKNAKDFQEKYSQKLKNILPEDIFKKLSGSFELNWNIDKTIDSLKDSWLSEKSVDLIKSNLKQNVDISKENLDEINKEIKEFSEKKDLDIKLWDFKNGWKYRKWWPIWFSNTSKRNTKKLKSRRKNLNDYKTRISYFK